jgi:hypothetical protein
LISSLSLRFINCWFFFSVCTQSRQKEAKQIEEELKRAKNKKAVKEWKKLRKNGRYKSMVRNNSIILRMFLIFLFIQLDNKAHEVPTRRPASHDSRWIAVEAENNVNHHHLPVTSSSGKPVTLKSVSNSSFDDRPLPTTAARLSQSAAATARNRNTSSLIKDNNNNSNNKRPQSAGRMRPQTMTTTMTSPPLPKGAKSSSRMTVTTTTTKFTTTKVAK